jgi:hypothetical protein
MAANTKTSWLDESANTSLISEKAQQLDSFLSAVADGKVTDAELKAQEERLVKLMKEIEPQLEPALHGRVTELLCELTAYDLMQTLKMMQTARSATKFRG